MDSYDTYLDSFGVVDVICVLGGGIVPRKMRGGKVRRYQSTAYSHMDRNGLLGGGKARIIATAHLLAHHFPYAVAVTVGNQILNGEAVEAHVLAEELVRYGVSAGRIMHEDKSANTLQTMDEIVLLIERYGWRDVLMITSEYHMARAKLSFDQPSREVAPGVGIAWQRVSSLVNVSFVSAESILMHRSPHYWRLIARAKELPSYKNRVVFEERGRAKLESGGYIPMGGRQRKERVCTICTRRDVTGVFGLRFFYCSAIVYRIRHCAREVVPPARVVRVY
ncbi:MAG: YdcF family protein [Candidatus Sungbacteria bacterium]|nr:YdcF family protein [Candidatus Sungbacteria bacterium]